MLNIIPISPTPKKKDSSGRYQARKDGHSGNFAELLRRAGQEQQSRQRSDGFARGTAPAVLPQSDMGLVRQRVLNVNEEIMALLR